MMQTGTPVDSLLTTIVLATLAVGLPIVFVLAIRFLWERQLNLGRSKELEKLIWQLHRIASAMEHQMNLSFPAVQPGTEEARDIAFLKQVAQPMAAVPSAQKASAASATRSEAPAAAAKEAAAPAAVEQETKLPPLERREPSVEAPRAGVNSMFGL
jgi:hypothetical protein